MTIQLLEQHERTRLTWLHEPPNWSWTDEQELVIQAPAGADFFKDPGGTHMVHSAPYLYTAVDSTFELTTTVRVDMKHVYDSGCLMIMQDENNWAKLCFEYNGEYATIVSVVTTNGFSDDCNSERVDVAQPYLRITKREQVVSFYYSTDGIAWRLIRYFGMNGSLPATAGVVAQSPMGTGCEVCFHQLTLSVPPPDHRFE